jgi:protein phosphatase PTC2/3
MNTTPEKELEAAFHLVGVPIEYGNEESHRILGSGATLTTIQIYPYIDINLRSTLKVEIEIPVGYPSSDAGPMLVIPDNIEPFRNSSIIQRCPNIIKQSMGKQELIFPWLEDTKYPVSVWFFTIRNLLKKENIKSSILSYWSNPMLLRSQLPHKRRYHHNRISTSMKSNVTIKVGQGQTRGKRPYMEDTNFSFGSTRMNDIYQTVSIMGVLDGHGGAECALFVADELPGIISSIARRQGNNNSSLSRGASLSKSSKSNNTTTTNNNGAALPEVLFNAFRQADEEWMRSSSNPSGSTACIMLYDYNTGRAYIGNSGDTRAVMSRAGKALDLTKDKKATDPDEIARVAIAGGHVTRGRVMGSLAVSRAFGDAQLKKSRGLKKGLWASGTETVIIDPEVTSFRPQRRGDINNDDEFIIIATDGLWDVMSSQQAVDSVKKAFNDNNTDINSITEGDLSKICNLIANNAVQIGSQDNITVMIIRLYGNDGDGYTTDDDDSDLVSDDETTTTTNDSDGKYNSSTYGYDSATAKKNNGMQDDLNSLLKNIPNKYAPTTDMYAPKPKPKSNASASTYISKAAPSDDDLDMDFLLDDSNF